LDAARQEIAKLAELAQRLGQPRAQAVHVRAALRRRDQVHVAFEQRLAAVAAPDDGPVDRLSLALQPAAERRVGQKVALADGLLQVLLETAGVTPPLLLVRLLDRQRDL